MRELLVYSHSSAMSGAEIALLNTVPVLRHLHPTVICGEDGPLVHELRGRGVDVHLEPLPRGARAVGQRHARVPEMLRNARDLPRHLRRLRRSIRLHAPDILLTNSARGHVVVLLATLGLRAVPVVCYVRDRLTPESYSRPVIALLNTLFRLGAAGIIANSRSTYRSLGRVNRSIAAAIIPSPVVAPPEAGQSTGGDDHAGPVIGIVGRLSPWKGQDLLIRAFAGLTEHTDARLEIVGAALFGEDDYVAHLHQLCRDLAIADRVTFLGHRDDVYDVMARWEVCVHASTIPEPFGQVVVQGMALGLPVLASGEGGPLETITAEVDGLLFEPRDQQSLEQQLHRLLVDGDLRARLGKAAQVRAAAFLPEVVVPQIEAFLLQRAATGKVHG